MDSERLPRGADPATHAKLGRGGLADVEWTVQLLQLRYGHAVPELRTPYAAGAGGGPACRADRPRRRARPGRGLALRRRGCATRSPWSVAGRADQLPRHGSELAGVVATLGGEDSGEFVDDYLRAARRARRVFERVFNGWRAPGAVNPAPGSGRRVRFPATACGRPPARLTAAASACPQWTP